MGCEEMALAKIRGEYKTEPSNAMMIGSYVDSYYEGTLDEFRTKNPQIFRKDGKLLSGFQKAEDIIARTERDELFQKYMSGKKQVIMTAELFGVPWKIKMDLIWRQSDRRSESDGNAHKVELGPGYRIFGFCQILGLRYTGSCLPGSCVSEYGQETPILHCRSFQGRRY